MGPGEIFALDCGEFDIAILIIVNKFGSFANGGRRQPFLIPKL